MDVQFTVFSFFGGLALFLFGMNFMSEGLKKSASESFKRILQTVTKNRGSAILVGMGITCLIQSSSATSVMVIGFVNAGLLVFKQAVAVVLGADIGTTITAWIVSALGIEKFSIAEYSLPLIAVGFVLNFVAKNRKRKMIGQAILGFGLLFLGLGTMSMGVKAFKESEMIRDFFDHYGRNPFLGIIAGTLVTMIIQSSSATIAIVQLMAFQGVFGLEAAIPLMMGADIGTTITAQFAAIGGTRNARGVAMANSFFKILGALIFLPLLLTGFWEESVRFVIPDRAVEGTVNGGVMVQIAFAHTAYIAINVLIFSVGLWPLLIRVAKWAARINDDPREAEVARHLDPLVLDTPPIAIELCVQELEHMVRLCHENIAEAFRSFIDKDLKQIKRIEDREATIDQMQDSITNYLVHLSRRDLGEREGQAIPKLLHAINDAERVGDHAENLMELANLQVANKITLSIDAQRQLHNFYNLVDKQFQAVLDAIASGERRGVHDTLVLEGQINSEHERLVQCHILRLEAGTCTVPASHVFVEVLVNLEKVGDHLTNIAERLDV